MSRILRDRQSSPLRLDPAVARVLWAAVLLLAPAAAASAQSVTFTRDIAPLVFEHCAACHHDGGAGPFPLLTYTAVKQHATQIADVTRRRYMPPWKPNPAGSL